MVDMVRRLKIINKVILALNMIVYRVDALLNNFIDAILLLSYSVALALIMGYEVDHCNIWLRLITLPISLHMLYMVVYVINDLLDYKRTGYLKPSIDTSFYQLRPIYYFRGSKIIIAYFILLYLMIIVLLSIHGVIPFLQLLVFIGIIVPLAFLHSFRNITLRVVTFYLLRIAKYVYLLTALHTVIFNHFYEDVFIFSVLSLAIPYVTYATLDYTKHYSSKSITRTATGLTLSACLISLLLLENITRSHSLIELFWDIIVGYTFIVLPVLAVRQGLRKLLGAYNPTYYHHLSRLALGAMLVFIALSLALNLLIYAISYGLILEP